MKLVQFLLFLFGVLRASSAAEVRLVGASVGGENLYVCISRERRSYGRSYLGEQPTAELKSWSIESREISLASGRTQRRWKVDLKKELSLRNHTVYGFIGMAGENLYFRYLSSLYNGPIHGHSDRKHGVIHFDSHGLHLLGPFPTNVNWFAISRPLPRLDGGLRVVYEDATFVFSSNGIHQVASPLVVSPALAEDWRNGRTMDFDGLRIGTFGPDAELLWHLRFPLPRSRGEWVSNGPCELIQQVGEDVRVWPIRHRTAGFLWDGNRHAILSQGSKPDWELGVELSDGSRTSLGSASGSWVTDPTARTLVIIGDPEPGGHLNWWISQELKGPLRLRILRLVDGKLTERQVTVALD